MHTLSRDLFLYLLICAKISIRKSLILDSQMQMNFWPHGGYLLQLKILSYAYL